jgi:methylase of polypeptide subunit release factors
MPTPSQTSFDPQSQLFQQLREILRTSGYCDAGIAPTINEEPLSLPDASAEPTPLNTLLRLFFMSEDCQPHDVSAALHPLTLDQLVKAGILRLQGDFVSTAIRIQPYRQMLFLFPRDTPGATPEESLMLISPSSLEVAHLMTRRPSRTALDIGTGCGVLAALLAPFCRQVCAIDVNPAAVRVAEFNARWNGLANISFLAGNLLEPVLDRRFDLIVCNPPFLITPVPGVFSARFLFKHSGLPGDIFCINLAREASQLLEEDGYFHMMFQWEEPSDGPWSTHLEKSFSGLGCDVWIARIMTVTAEQYVSEWIEGLSDTEQPDAEILAQQARKYFQDRNVATTSTGLLTLRRASQRPNYLWFDEAPDDRLEPYGASVSALFDIRIHVTRLNDSALLQEKLRTSPHLAMLQNSRIAGGRWEPRASELLLAHGLKYSFGDVHLQLAQLLAHLDGTRTVCEAFDLLPHKNAEGTRAAIATHLPGVRELLWYGFLIPAQLAVE